MYRDVEQLSIAVLRAYVVHWSKHNLHILVLSYNKRESRRLDSLVTSLSGLDDGDGRHVVAVLGLALGELQLDAARLAQSDRRRFGVAVEARRPGQAHLGQHGSAVVVAAVVLGERDNGEGLVLHSGEVEGIDGDAVWEGVDKLLGGNLLAVVLESGQQGGVHCGFTEVKHNFISFLCGRQAGLFIQSRRLDLNRSEIGTGLFRPRFGGNPSYDALNYSSMNDATAYRISSKCTFQGHNLMLGKLTGQSPLPSRRLRCRKATRDKERLQTGTNEIFLS